MFVSRAKNGGGEEPNDRRRSIQCIFYIKYTKLCYVIPFFSGKGPMSLFLKSNTKFYRGDLCSVPNSSNFGIYHVNMGYGDQVFKKSKVREKSKM